MKARRKTLRAPALRCVRDARAASTDYHTLAVDIALRHLPAACIGGCKAGGMTVDWTLSAASVSHSQLLESWIIDSMSHRH
eukprot:4915656-Pleurochrysis_carterae.AAC.1